MEISLGSELAKLPPSISIIATIIIIAFTLWQRKRETLLKEKESERKLQNEQVENLMDQIRLLSEELEKTREQLSKLHEQNIDLMTKLREANKRISDLEISLAHSTNK